MNQNFIILLLVVIIIGVVLYYNTNSKKEKDSGNTPTFEVVGVSVSKTENYKPWFTETYTADEYTAMSKGSEFTYTLRINSGSNALTSLSITRKSPDAKKFDTKDVPSKDWVNEEDIIVKFPALEDENIKGKHTFSINYTIPGISKAGVAGVDVIVTDNDLSVGLESGVVELNFTESDVSAEAGFQTQKEYMFITDSDGKVNFGSENDVYFSPVEETGGRGFKIQGTDIEHTLYKYKVGYRMYFSTSPDAKFNKNYMFLNKYKTLIPYGEDVDRELGFMVSDSKPSESPSNIEDGLIDIPIDPVPAPPDIPFPPGDDPQPIPDDPPVDPSPLPPADSLEIAKAGPFIINRNEGKNCHPNGQWKYIWYSAQHANDKNFCGALSDDECETKTMDAQWWSTENNNGVRGDFRGGAMQRCVLDPAPISETCSGPLTIGATISNGSFEPINFGTKSTSGVGGYIFGVKAKTDIRITCISCLSKHPDPYGRQKGTDDGKVVMYRLKPGRSRFRSWCPSGRWSCDSGNASFPRDYDHTINSNESDWTLIGEALPSGGDWSDTTLNVSEDVSAGQIAYFYINSTMDGYMTVGQKSLDYQRLPEVGNAGVLYSDEQCELGFGFGVYGGSESEGNLGEPFLDKYENYHVHPEWLRLSYQKIS